MKILLAVDDTPASRLAVEEVAARPWPEGSEVELFHIVEAGPAWGHAEGVQSAYEHATTLMKKLAERVYAAGLKTQTTVAIGDPKTAIVKRAGDIGADLVVLGSHHVSMLAHFLLGNTAKYTVRHSPCSALIVRGDHHEMGAPRRILLATDGSEPAEAAAHAIAARTWPLGSEFRVISVVEVVLPTMHALFDPPFIQWTEVQKLREEALLRAQNATAAAAAILAQTGMAVSEAVSILLEGTRSVILKEANDWGADLIFLGSHGHGATERLLLGSVSEWIATHAPCSVEVIRPRVKAPENG